MPEPTVAPVITPTEPPARPEYVPEDLWDAEKGVVKVESMAKSLADTKAAYTQSQQAIAALKGEGQTGLQIPKDTPASTLADDEATIDTILESAGLTKEDVAKAWIANEGKLTDEQYAAFKTKANLGKKIVDGVIGQQIGQAHEQAQAALGTCETIAGGKAQLANLLAFGKTLTPAEQGYFNSQAANAATMVPVVEWLKAKHAAAVGSGKAQPLLGGDGAATATGGYATRGEMMAARSDPKFGRDKAYTADVRARCLATGNINNLPA